MRTITTLSGILLVLLLTAACGGEAEEDQPTSGVAAAAGAESPLVGLPELEPDTPYVSSLCSIDFLTAAEADDPIGRVIDDLASLPTSSTTERDEVGWMIERLERHRETSDPFGTEDLFSVGALLRARCG